MKKTLALLVTGLLLGGAMGWFGHQLIAPRWAAEGEEVEARILGERSEEDRIILTLEVDDRTLLVSFRERRDDVASLVEAGDTIILRVPADGPFADDPEIVAVERVDGDEPRASDSDPEVPDVLLMDAGTPSDAAVDAADGAPDGEGSAEEAEGASGRAERLRRLRLGDSERPAGRSGRTSSRERPGSSRDGSRRGSRRSR